MLSVFQKNFAASIRFIISFLKEPFVLASITNSLKCCLSSEELRVEETFEAIVVHYFDLVSV